jgi:hypothetical protein
VDLDQTNRIASKFSAASGWGMPRYIAHGNSAAVYEIAHPVHGQAALKVYDPTFFEGANSLIETQRIRLQEGLKNHDNPHLIGIFAAYELPDVGTWCLLMEFCPWPTLEERLASIPDENVHGLIKQLVIAVLFLEGQLLVHRDIKPANILISPNLQTLKLLDLGVVRRIDPDEGNGTDDGEKRRFIATAQYSPPEYLTRDELPGIEGFVAINIYQVGAILHDLIAKKPIFMEEASSGNKFILYNAVTTKVTRVFSQSVPARLLAICNGALQKDPRRRLSAVKLADFLTDLDDVDALRRRIGALVGSVRSGRAPPSILVWERRVRGWIGVAIRQEKETLGTANVRRKTSASGVEWRVTFPALDRAIVLEILHAGPESLVVQIVAQTIMPTTLTVFEIGTDGLGMEDGEAITLLAGHILYGIDLATTADKAGGDDAAVMESIT